MSLFLRLRKQNPCRIALFRFVYNISSSDTHKLFPIGWFMYETFTGFSWAIPARTTMSFSFWKTAILPSVPDAHSLFLLMNAHAFFRSWSLLSLFPYRIPYCTVPFRDAGTRCFFTQPIVFFSFIGITQYELPATHYLLNIWLRFPGNTDTHLTHTNQLKGLSRGDLLRNTALILRICCRWSVSQWSVPPFPLF